MAIPFTIHDLHKCLVEVSSVTVRSPIGCRSPQGICVHCYGADLANWKPISVGEAVGTVAAQAIGEPGTQLTMRTKHEGGAASVGGDVTQGLPRVEEIFERRMPRSPAVISSVSGVVADIRDENGKRIMSVMPNVEDMGKGKKSGEVTYEILPRRTALVKMGDVVEKGQFLTDGSADLTQLFQYAGKRKTLDYILREVTKVYELVGVTISVKHIEVVARQMFSRVRIIETGDTEFSLGDVTGEIDLAQINTRVKEAGGNPAKSEPMIMGILDVSLSRASFLSAASFQNTTRMLIKAAVYGAVDTLTGLKENVIIGRLIPAGTGFHGSVKERLISSGEHMLVDADASTNSH